MPEHAKSLQTIPPYLTADLNRKAAALQDKGADVISFAMGDPDLPTPEMVVKTLQEEAAKPENHQYPPCQGLPQYRHAIKDWMKTRFNATIDADREVVSLIGSKEGLGHVIMAHVNPGDVVLIPSPGYPVYRNYTLLVGGTPVTMPLLKENHFLPDLGALSEETARAAKIMFLNYPNNPTGAIVTDDFIKEAIDFCRRHDILLCHDNAYSEMTFDDYKAPAFLQYEGAKEVCVEFFSMSKMVNMTGWRVGFAVGNEKALAGMLKVKNNTDTGIFKPIQLAAITALENTPALTKANNKIYKKRQDIVMAGLRELGWDFPPNKATFYLWAPTPEGVKSMDFSQRLLDECAIVVPPGIGYGAAGEGFFRIALTRTEDRLRDALSRMKNAGIRYK